jgi:hypothetical protein
MLRKYWKSHFLSSSLSITSTYLYHHPTMSRVSFHQASRNTSFYKLFNCLSSHEQIRLGELRKQKYRAILLLAFGKGRIRKGILKKYLIFTLRQIFVITVDRSSITHCLYSLDRMVHLGWLSMDVEWCLDAAIEWAQC